MAEHGKVVALLAKFETPGALLHAAREIHREGYTRFDAHSPFPIHGMDQAMGMKRSPLGYFVGVMGSIGLIGALALQGWTSAIDYPLVISGKPLFSYQAFVPITFAITVLLSAFGAFFGMLIVNRLPRLYHPLFFSPSFAKVTEGGFFVSIDVADPKFDRTRTTGFLKSIGALSVEEVTE